MEKKTKNILIAPLNWGLGHATRCIPIIKALEENGYSPLIASDGNALALLNKEFPHLKCLELPSYEIKYAKKGRNFKWKLLQNTPKIIQAIFKEKKVVQKWIQEFELDGIISDNRLGVYSKRVPSVFITHQLNVLSGNTSWISSKLHLLFLKKYTECWVPDFENEPNLSGKLGHLKRPISNVRYIGPLSRFEKKEVPIKYDLMVLLSGPEPQRGILEMRLREKISEFKGTVVFVQGKIGPDQIRESNDTVHYYNFMTSEQLERTFNESQIVLCRSGYTSIMDLAKLGKKAFFIPTPGQYEQEYLARKLKRDGLFTFANQDHFRISNLDEVGFYKGIKTVDKNINWESLFYLFN